MLTTFDTDEHVVEALRAGASGFLLKDVTPADFVAAIRVVAAGEALIAPSVTRRLLERFAQLPPPADAASPAAQGAHRARAGGAQACRPGPLQPRDRRPPRLAEPTVKTHVSHLLLKLDLRDRAQLVVLAYEVGDRAARVGQATGLAECERQLTRSRDDGADRDVGSDRAPFRRSSIPWRSAGRRRAP